MQAKNIRRPDEGPAARACPRKWLPYVIVENVDDSAAKVAGLGGKVMAPPFDIPTVAASRSSSIRRRVDRAFPNGCKITLHKEGEVCFRGALSTMQRMSFRKRSAGVRAMKFGALAVLLAGARCCEGRKRGSGPLNAGVHRTTGTRFSSNRSFTGL